MLNQYQINAFGSRTPGVQDIKRHPVEILTTSGTVVEQAFLLLLYKHEEAHGSLFTVESG